MVKFKDFSRPLSVFFKYFSRQIRFSGTFQDSPVYSSTFQDCANPVRQFIGAVGRQIPPTEFTRGIYLYLLACKIMLKWKIPASADNFHIMHLISLGN